MLGRTQFLAPTVWGCACHSAWTLDGKLVEDNPCEQHPCEDCGGVGQHKPGCEYIAHANCRTPCSTACQAHLRPPMPRLPVGTRVRYVRLPEWPLLEGWVESWEDRPPFAGLDLSWVKWNVPHPNLSLCKPSDIEALPEGPKIAPPKPATEPYREPGMRFCEDCGNWLCRCGMGIP